MHIGINEKNSIVRTPTLFKREKKMKNANRKYPIFEFDH
jgi:hypothetical protein